MSRVVRRRMHAGVGALIYTRAEASVKKRGQTGPHQLSSRAQRGICTFVIHGAAKDLLFRPLDRSRAGDADFRWWSDERW